MSTRYDKQGREQATDAWGQPTKRVRCPRCGQRELLVTLGNYGDHGPDPEGWPMCRKSSTSTSASEIRP